MKNKKTNKFEKLSSEEQDVLRAQLQKQREEQQEKEFEEFLASKQGWRMEED